MTSRRSASKANQRLLQKCNNNSARISVKAHPACSIGFVNENAAPQAVDLKAMQQAKKTRDHQKRNERRKRVNALKKQASAAAEAAAKLEESNINRASAAGPTCSLATNVVINVVGAAARWAAPAAAVGIMVFMKLRR